MIFRPYALGLPGALWLVAAITFASGVLAAIRMTETMPSVAKNAPRLAGALPLTGKER